MLLVPIALASPDTGTIVVTVTDQYGNPLPGTTCLLWGPERTPWPVHADAGGECSFPGLSPGSGYDVHIRRKDAPEEVRKINLTVLPGTAARTSVALRQGRAFGGLGTVRLVMTDDDGERLDGGWCELHGYPLGPQERTVDAVDGECVFEDVPGGQYYWAVAHRDGRAAAHHNRRTDVLAAFAVRDGRTVSAWLVPSSFLGDMGGMALEPPPPDPDRPSRFLTSNAGGRGAEFALRRTGANSLADVVRLVPGGFPHGATVYVDGVPRIER